MAIVVIVNDVIREEQLLMGSKKKQLLLGINNKIKLNCFREIIRKSREENNCC